jgi:drug/metabolite transporter (DMT)-like permease
LATTQLSLSSMMLIPVAFAGPHPSALRPASVAAMIFLGIAGSGFAYLIYYSLLAHISATHVVAVTYLIPIWGLLWGYLAHESVGWTAYVGVVIVIAGLVLLNFRAFRAVSPPAPIASRV